MLQPTLNKPLETLYTQIKDLLVSARAQTIRAVNTTMVQTYWNIGRIIVEEEQKGERRAEYGTSLLRELSKKLQKDFGNGFDERNLQNMRRLYSAFPIPNALRSELTWTHYRLLLRVENEHAREFYISESIENNWSTRSLERQINSFYYERLLSSKNRKPVIEEAHAKTSSLDLRDVIKDPYVLEFLSVEEGIQPIEHDMEDALLHKLQDFLLELGKGFSFVARQKRITLENDHFFIDLVFYNYMLRCFVLVELKTGKLTHQDIGQMDFYVRYFEKEMRREDDNPTIGILLCADKNDTMIKYTLLDESKSVFASRYKLYLPTEAELKAELEKEKMYLELGKEK